jgi:hypothetical protein
MDFQRILHGSVVNDTTGPSWISDRMVIVLLLVVIRTQQGLNISSSVITGLYTGKVSDPESLLLYVGFDTPG